MDKFGKTDLVTIAIIALLVFGGYYFYKQMQTPATTTTTPQNLVPADLKTSITLYAKDALATTSTNVPTDYYIFKSTGEFYAEGNTGNDGKDTFDVQYGGNYKMIIYNETNADGYYPVEMSFIADTGEGSVKTITSKLYSIGGVEISSARDPIDLNGNISCALGSTSAWQILYKENVSNAAIMKPILVVDGNQTGIDSAGITVTGWNSIECPSRLTVASARKKWCFASADTITSAMGIQTINGAVKFHDTNSPGCGANSLLTFSILDQQMYKEPAYVTTGYSAFKVGAEDVSDTNVGAADSVVASIGFGG